MERIKDEEKDEYIDFLMRQIRLADAYWFLGVEKSWGLPAAVKVNEEVWETIGAKTAREIKRRFSVPEKGLDGFVRAQMYYPWTRISGHVITREGGKVIITVPSCLPQVARIKSGLGEFPCKDMHLKEFCAFAKEIDDTIEVKCVYAPPDAHPQTCFCRWEFTIRKKNNL